MSGDEVTITVRSEGSYKVQGRAVVKDADGNVLHEGDSVFLCRCGFSKEKPFCDGSHKTAAGQTWPGFSAESD